MNESRIDNTQYGTWTQWPAHVMTTVGFVTEFRPCREGRDFALQYQNMSEVWDNCPRADWLLWICKQMNIRNDKQFRLFAVWCIRNMMCSGDRTMWDLLTDERSRNAVVVAEKFANGEASVGELKAARQAANAAYDGIANAEAHTPQLVSAAYAAHAAADVAIERTVYAAAHGVVWPEGGAEQVRQFRLMIPNPFKP